jgi:4-hydroxybenzoate polyprenyltransferase
MIASRVRVYASFVRFSHSVFALPFAFAGAFLAFNATNGITRAVALWRIAWIVVAMVSARSAAMGFNRLVDARYDALNPRTADRELPRGAMSRAEALVFVAGAAAVFLVATSQLPRICFVLAPVALVIVFWYSLAKRFTTWTQLFLGLAMAVAPVGGWLAAGGRADRLEPWLLGLAIAMWVGGFDILYACQDLDFDRAHGLRSIPVRFGIGASLLVSRVMHTLAVLCLAGIGFVPGPAPLGPVYLVGLSVVAALLAYEQSLVTADDLSRVKRAFDLNGYVGILYFLVVIVALYGPWRS